MCILILIIVLLAKIKMLTNVMLCSFGNDTELVYRFLLNIKKKKKKLFKFIKLYIKPEKVLGFFKHKKNVQVYQTLHHVILKLAII